MSMMHVQIVDNPTGHSRKRSHTEMHQTFTTSKWIDDDYYRRNVLGLLPAMTEDETDENLNRDATQLGISVNPSQKDVKSITSSLSETTISSDTHPGSIMSQSTGPTSCASSEYRPSTVLSQTTPKIPEHKVPSPTTSDFEKKKYSGLKSGFRRIPGFRKRRSMMIDTSRTSSIDSASVHTAHSARESRTPHRSPKNLHPLSHRHSYFADMDDFAVSKVEEEPMLDSEAMKRSVSCRNMVYTRTQQLAERQRFLDYQSNLLSHLHEERDAMKREKAETHRRRIEEQESKNEKAIEELESRHLEEELRFMKEHEHEKRSIMARLRHMEAYCQTPSPPSSPASHSDTNSLRISIDSAGFHPERHITQQHYESLAQQYRRRDTMDSLHASRINVLRGTQKRAIENFVRKKEREIEALEKEQAKEIHAFDQSYTEKEKEIHDEFDARRSRLELRWQLQALIEKTKAERETGLAHEALPPVTAVVDL